MADQIEGDHEIRVGVRELRSKLTHYLRLAGQGAPVLITLHDTVIAELRPPRPEVRPPRQPGALQGKIWMADDFDEWPPGFLDAMEA